MKETITGAEMVVRILRDHGVTNVFGYPGGSVLPIYDALYKQSEVRHILTRHEQGAVHAAEGYARSTGKVGAILVTSGPGATNTITGLADAYLDSIPLVCITGQVTSNLIGTNAFQECDTFGITRHCTKHNFLVKSIEDLPRILHEAFYVASHGRPGPVVVDLPKDIQFASGVYEKPDIKKYHAYQPETRGNPASITEAVMLMAQAERPVFYTGGGIINSGPQAAKALQEIIKLTGFPITSTLMGLGAYPGDDKMFLGMLGMHGTYEANMAMHESDLIIAVGARFDDRVTGHIDSFSPYAKKIHIDIDPSSLNKIIHVDVPIVGDCGSVLNDMIQMWQQKALKVNSTALHLWWECINTWRARNCLNYTHSAHVIKPQYAIERLYELTKDRDVYISTEVGQHQMWTAQFFKFREPNHFMTSGGLGTMGYGLPAAIGTQLAHPNSLVINIAGDASIQMNIQELGTAAQHCAPVKVFILNNNYMGMVRQWQELMHEERYSQSLVETQPDFIKLAEAYGGIGIRCDNPGDLDDAIRQMINSDTFVLFDCIVEKTENCFPMIPPGNAHNEMLFSIPGNDSKSGK